MSTIMVTATALLLVAAASPPASPKKQKSAKSAPPEKPQKRETYEDIIRNYVFVADFNQKESTRAVSDELFWAYPFKTKRPEFPFQIQFKDLAKELPPTPGSGRAIQQLNFGRASFLEGKTDEARRIWLAARANFAKSYPQHRRNDYFIGYSFANLALDALKVSTSQANPYEDVGVKSNFNNAATFLSWAFLVKKDVEDQLVEEATPKGLYNLAAIYFRYGRWAGAYGAAEEGLNFLRRTGRKDFRTEFRRFIAESHIENRSYLEALQEIDAALRQDRDKSQAAAMFARAGDIYFNLANYELAEDAYRLSGVIDEELQHVSANQLVLRGESLFWLGKFAESQRMFHYALAGIPFRKNMTQIPMETASWAKLRFADAWMAQKKFKEATLAYFQVEHEYRGSEASRVAEIRRACLELPFYLGNNVGHAREMLEKYKSATDIPVEAQELVWACFTGSFAQRERTRAMVEKVRSFADKYPESRFLRSMAEPVREVQAQRIEDFFAAGNFHGAVAFFEKNRKVLFSKISEDLAQKLFVAYVSIFRSEGAAEFWSAYDKVPSTETKLMRQAVVVVENLAKLAEQSTAQDVKSKKRPKGRGKEIDKTVAWLNRSEVIAAKLGDSGDKGGVSRPWATSPSREVIEYIARIRSTEEGQRTHLTWILSLAMFWGKTDPSLACELEYPLLVQIAEKMPSNWPPERFVTHVNSLVNRTLPGSLDTDESCAASLLDLEAKTLEQQPKVLAATYMNRRSWPMKTAFVNRLWQTAEKLHEAGDKEHAREMWQTLVSKAPQEMPEVAFAKARLDPKKTEFENLWN